MKATDIINKIINDAQKCGVKHLRFEDKLGALKEGKCHHSMTFYLPNIMLIVDKDFDSIPTTSEYEEQAADILSAAFLYLLEVRDGKSIKVGDKFTDAEWEDPENTAEVVRVGRIFMEKKLLKLIELCKWSFSIEYNPHADNFQTVEMYFADLKQTMDIDNEDIHPEVMALMVKKNTVFYIHCYPNNSVGFYTAWHYDLEEAIDKIIECIESM